MSDAYIADCVTQIGELQDFLTTYKNCNVNLVKIMEKICATPLIEFDIYNVFNIKVLREYVRDTEQVAAEKILEMYKEIVTYLIIVYEGFEAHISQMAEYWVRYVRRFDCLLEDALKLAIKATMQNMYKCVHGDGTMAPSPLIKMKLFLTGKIITYEPTKYEVRDTFSTVFEEIIHILSTIPRLFEKFALPAAGLKRFMEAISYDADCNKLQSLMDDEIEFNLNLIHEHMKMWDPYAHIWKIDKDEFMEQYREEGHKASDFDDRIVNYTDLANAVQMQETTNQIHFITLNSADLKKSIIAHCLVWQIKLGELLRKITESDIDKVYAYVEKSSVEAMTMPNTLKELAASIATYERLMSEVESFEKTFPPITDKINTLAKFEVEVSSDMAARHENIPVLWAQYLNLLEEAKKALELNKDKFKAELLEQAEDSSESRSSENGEGVREVRGSVGTGEPVGGVVGEVQDADLLGNGDGRDGRKRHVFV